MLKLIERLSDMVDAISSIPTCLINIQKAITFKKKVDDLVTVELMSVGEINSFRIITKRFNEKGAIQSFNFPIHETFNSTTDECVVLLHGPTNFLITDILIGNRSDFVHRDGGIRSARIKITIGELVQVRVKEF